MVIAMADNERLNSGRPQLTAQWWCAVAEAQTDLKTTCKKSKSNNYLLPGSLLHIATRYTSKPGIAGCHLRYRTWRG